MGQVAQLPETLHRRRVKGLEIGEQLPLAVEQAPTVQGAQVALVHTVADHTVEVQGQVGLHGAEFSRFPSRLATGGCPGVPMNYLTSSCTND